MERCCTEGKNFDKTDFTRVPMRQGEYEDCRFNNCNLSNSDLSGIYFSECCFTGCNLSAVSLIKTTFIDVTFSGCKLLGLHFEQCNDLMSIKVFENCLLNLSSFYGLKLKKQLFKDCALHEVDFTGADMTASVFDNCDLSGSIFENTILEKADLHTSFNYCIDPEINKIKKAKFSTDGLPGLLRKYGIEII